MSIQSHAYKRLLRCYGLVLGQERARCRRLDDPAGKTLVSLEELEPRILLSAQPILAAQKTAIEDGLAGLTHFATLLESYGAFAENRPVTADALGATLDLDTLIGERFVNPLTDYLDPAATQSGDDLTTYLLGQTFNGQFGDVSVQTTSATTSQAGGELQTDVTVRLDRTVSAVLDLGPGAADAGFSLTDGQPVELTDELLLDLSFGVDTSNQFFVVIRSLKASSSALAERTAEQAAPAGGDLGQDVSLTVVLNGTTTATATIPAASYTAGHDANDLAATLNASLAGALGGAAEVVNNGRRAERPRHDRRREHDPGPGRIGTGLRRGDGGGRSAGPRRGARRGGAERRIGGRVDLGGIDVTVDNGPDGRLDASELAPPGDAIGALVTLTPEGSAEVVLPVSPLDSSVLLAGRPEVVVTSSDVFSASPPAVSFTDLAEIDALNAQAGDALASGVDALAAFGGQLGATGELATTLPLIGQSIGELADVEDVIRRGLADGVQAYLASLSPGQAPTRAGIESAILAGAQDFGDGLVVSFPGGVSSQLSADGSELALSFHLLGERTLDLQADLGAEGEDLGVAFNDAPGRVRATVDLDMTMGLDLGALPGGGAFFVELNAPAAVSAEVLSQAGPLEGRVGLLGVRVADSSALSMQASVAVTFNAATGRALADELRGSAVTDIASLNPTAGTIGPTVLNARAPRGRERLYALADAHAQ